MKAKELAEFLKGVEPSAEVVLVVYTDKGYKSGYVERVDANVRYNSVTQQKLNDDEKVVELTTSVKVGK